MDKLYGKSRSIFRQLDAERAKLTKMLVDRDDCYRDILGIVTS